MDPFKQLIGGCRRTNADAVEQSQEDLLGADGGGGPVVGHPRHEALLDHLVEQTRDSRIVAR